MASVDTPPRLPTRKPERSCIVCHKRKVRCDRLSPCSPCSQGHYECHYPQPQQGPVRRAPRKTAITDGVASRISELERAVAAASQRQNQKKRVILPYYPVQDTVVSTPHVAGYRDASQVSTGHSQKASNHLAATAVANAARAARHEPLVRATVASSSKCNDENLGDEVLLRKGSFSQYINETLFSRVFEQVSLKTSIPAHKRTWTHSCAHLALEGR